MCSELTQRGNSILNSQLTVFRDCGPKFHDFADKIVPRGETRLLAARIWVATHALDIVDARDTCDEDTDEDAFACKLRIGVRKGLQGLPLEGGWWAVLADDPAAWTIRRGTGVECGHGAVEGLG
jgi:hypothetical protein